MMGLSATCSQCGDLVEYFDVLCNNCGADLADYDNFGVVGIIGSPDGRKVVTFADGTMMVKLADGRTTWFAADGDINVNFPDAPHAWTDKNGLTTYTIEHGPEILISPSGWTCVALVGDTIDPRVGTINSDGSVTYRFEDGQEVWIDSDGSVGVAFADGMQVRVDVDQDTQVKQKDGRLQWIFADQPGELIQDTEDDEDLWSCSSCGERVPEDEIVLAPHFFQIVPMCGYCAEETDWLDYSEDRMSFE